MERNEFIKALEARLRVCGATEEIAVAQAERMRVYLESNGMDEVDVDPGEMAEGILLQLGIASAPSPVDTGEDATAATADNADEQPVPAESEAAAEDGTVLAAVTPTEERTSDTVTDTDGDAEAGAEAETEADTDTGDEAVNGDTDGDSITDDKAAKDGDDDLDAKIQEALSVLDRPRRTAPMLHTTSHAKSQQTAGNTDDGSKSVTDTESGTDGGDAETDDGDMKIVGAPAGNLPTNNKSGDNDNTSDDDNVDDNAGDAGDDADYDIYMPQGVKSQSAAKVRGRSNAQHETNGIGEWMEGLENKGGKPLFWVLFCIAVPFAVILTALVAILFVVFWVALAVMMIFSIAGMIAFIAVGAAISLIGIVYGVVQVVKGMTPIGMFEIGLGITVGAVVMLVSILVYNFAVRLIPFAMKQLARLVGFTFRKGREAFIAAKGACEKL